MGSDRMAKWIGGSFIVGSIFWAGATYQRISVIEQRLLEIREAIPNAARVTVLENKYDDLKYRLDKIEEKVLRR
jgi:hypothetical protein